MRYIYLALIISVSLFSCKKKGKADFTLRGTITNSTYSIPMEDAEVKLYEKIAGSSSYSHVGTSSTDGNGSYSFTFPRNSVESYKLIITKNLYFEINQLISFSDLSIDNDNVRDFSTTAMSWVELRFVNQDPLPNDILKYTQTEGKTGCEVCCPSGENILSGATDTAIYCINDGNTTYRYSYLLGATTGTEFAITTAFDTTQIMLNY